MAETVGARARARDTRAPRASSTPSCGVFSASATRCSRASIADLATRTAHPRWLVGGASSATGPPSTRAMLDANNAHPPLWLRVNRAADRHRGAASRVLRGGGVRRRTATPLAPDAMRVEPAADVRSLPGFAEGLRVRPGRRRAARDRVARTAQRANASSTPARRRAARPVICSSARRGGAEVTAVDMSAARLERVRDNLDRLGLAATLVRVMRCGRMPGGTAALTTASCSMCRARPPA